MGDVFGVFEDSTGLGFLKKKMDSAGSAPTVDYSTDATKDDAKKAKATRSALLATPGGIAGEEILAGGTSKRSTLFGN